MAVASEADDDPDPRHYQVQKIKPATLQAHPHSLTLTLFQLPPQYIGAKDRLRTPQAVEADTITESARYHFAPKSSY